jgi:hypothetical protein
MRKLRDYLPVGLIVIILCLGGIGWLCSPVDQNGRPILYLPDVKVVEDYQRLASEWAVRLGVLDGRLSTLLAGNSHDLFGQSRAAQGIFNDGLVIAQEIDFSDAPPALSGLRNVLIQTSLAYMEASRGVLQWVSAPDAIHHDQASTLMQNARRQLNDLEKNTWIHIP